MKLKELVAYLDDLLALDKFSRDASNNGLQVEGNAEVTRAVFSVDACQELFDAAAEKKADFCIIFTGGEAKYFVKRIKNTIFAEPKLVFCGLNRILEYNATTKQ